MTEIRFVDFSHGATLFKYNVCPIHSLCPEKAEESGGNLKDTHYRYTE
jgi:hypothetical protein